MNEKLFIYCRECLEKIVPDENHTARTGEAWFSSGDLYIEMIYRCPKCDCHNLVTMSAHKAEVMEVAV